MSHRPKTVSARDFRPKQAAPQHAITNVIGMLWLPQNSDRVLALVREGLDSLRVEYFGDRPAVTLDGTLQHAAAGSHTARLAVFFLLLNVDDHLKQKIVDMEVPRNHAKLTRFFDDLHARLAYDFLANEKQSVQEFVDACEETWVLA